MPRIVPLQLLKCLKVLLDDNGGILSESEVKRIAGLMTKYSKKLVSKCIYVQILKCTKTELLGEFMSAGGWSLTHLWLNDAIRAMNWPLVQEILELLLLCPVDVDRLKSNSAPKLVKGLCKDGGNEGVRILAVKLVEQWLKVVTSDATTMVPRDSSVTSSSLTLVNQSNPCATLTTFSTNVSPELKKQQKLQENPDSIVDEDPLADVGEEPPKSYSLTPAQKKATESGLIYKIVVKDGQQVFAKIESKNKPNTSEKRDQSEEEKHKNKVNEKNIDSQRLNMKIQEDIETEKDDKCKPFTYKENICSGDENSNSTDSKSNDSVQTLGLDKQNSFHKKEQTEDEKNPENKDYHKSALMNKKDDKLMGSGKDKKSNENDRKSSSSSHKSSSLSSTNHKSSSKSNNSSNRSLSSSSSHRNSADGGKPYSSSSNREKDKDRNCNNGNSTNRDKDSKEKSGKESSKHKSSSSSGKSISSNSSKDRHRDKEKTNLSSSKPTLSAVEKIDKDKDREISHVSIDKDKETLAKMTNSLEKIGRIPKKLREENAGSSGNITKPTSITIPSKKASMSIEIRRDNEKAKTVKTYKSRFRSHGLTEEAPPPPSRKGLKKPSSLSLPGTAIPATIPSLKRSTPPPINTSGTVVSRDSPVEKKSKIDINNLSVPNEKPGAIKLIPPKPKIQTLVETNLFSDALSAATGPKKDARKRKRPNLTLANKDTVTTSPISPDVSKVAPLKFYQDTLDENKDDDKRSEMPSDSSCTKNNVDKDVDSVEDDDDIPLKKVKDDIEEKVRREMQKTGSLDSNACNDADADTDRASGNAISDCNDFSTVEPDSPKKPGPGCGPNGPPGVLLLHRRKGPKKKLMWRPQDQLEQIRYFDLDETERVNVTKNFIDMKNLERFSERDAINMSRRGFNHEDNMEAQIPWKPLILIDDVPPQPEGNNSKERKVQADREQTTLRALYFSHAMIPDTPAEPDIEPHQPSEFTIIPLDDITANPDAVNDFTSMPWPDPKGSPQHDSVMDSNSILLNDLYGPQVGNSPAGGSNPFSPFMPYSSQPNPVWPINSAPQGPLPNNLNGINSMNLGPPSMICTGTFNGPMGPHRMALLGGPSSPSNIDNFGGGPSIMSGPGGPMGNGMPTNMIVGIGGQGGHNRFGGAIRPQQFGPPSNFAPGGGNFGPPVNINMPMTGPGPGMLNGPMNMVGHMTMNGLPANESIRCGNGNSHRGGGGGWRSGVSNFNDGNWRSANIGGAGGHADRGTQGNNRGKDNWVSNTSNICKQFLRSGNCRLGNKCKFIHPGKGGGSKNRY